MEFALGTVTLMALTMTVAMGVVTWRLVREERRRSAARLTALTAELQRQQSTAAGSSSSAPAVTAAAGQESRPSDRPAAEPRAPSPIDVTIRSSDGSSSGGGDVWPAGDLFAAPAEETGGWSRRLAALGVAGVVLALLVSAVVLLSLDGERTQVTTTAAPAPVELLALEYQRQDGFLAISGLVRNPAGGTAASQLSVLAMAFDHAGVMVASSRAPLQIDTLLPGGESPFTISLPGERASRYRVSFLIDDMTVPHVDRRATPVAGGAPGTES